MRLQQLIPSFKRVTKKQLFVAIFTSVVVINEWLMYAATSFSWPSLDTPGDDHVRVLFVADPQILSLLSDSEPKFPLSLITIWDADRYVSRGFQMALWKTKPDIVVFLGDLLNDGSIVDDTHFNATLQHFKNLLSVPNYVKHTIYLPGDNDIGGEGDDPVTPHKINRFYSFLNQSMILQYKFIDFIQMRAMDDFSFPDNKLPPVKDRVRILLSHMPLLPRTRRKTKLSIIRQEPSFIFSAHEHESFHFTGTKEEARAYDFQILKDGQYAWTFESTGPLLHEIVIPTCSYRMGKRDAGYGAADIEKSGRVTYTILWLPARFEQLAIYVGCLLLFIVIVCLPGILCIIRVCMCRPLLFCVCLPIRVLRMLKRS